MPNNSAAFSMVKELKLPQREIDIYNHLLQSLLVKVRSDAGVNANEIELNVPVMYYGHWDDVGPLGSNTTAVVMQDLKSLGFRMVDKRTGCTVDEAKLTLTALAHFHALTMGLIANGRNSDGTFVLPQPVQFIPKTPRIYIRILQILSHFIPDYVKMMRKSGNEQVNLINLYITEHDDEKTFTFSDCVVAGKRI